MKVECSSMCLENDAHAGMQLQMMATFISTTLFLSQHSTQAVGKFSITYDMQMNAPSFQFTSDVKLNL